MPIIQPRAAYWVKTESPQPAKPNGFLRFFCCTDVSDAVDNRIFSPKLAPRSFAQELQIGLQYFAPVVTKTGVNGSFFLCDSRGQRAAIFKPMNMEAGACKNHRLDPAHNVQFRKSILPGQGAGNEVLAYALDTGAFRNRYGIPKTSLLRLKHPAFEGEELGSAQAFVPNARPLSNMTVPERAQIPQQEWEKLNFRLISGSTDAHLGNILYCDATQKLYLIDSGDDFVGEDGECQYFNPWSAEPRCKNPMSRQESYWLEHLDIHATMNVFEQQALANEQANPLLKVSVDKYLTQVLRILLAQTTGRFKLTQAEWSSMMSSYRDHNGYSHSGPLEHIYDEYIRPHSKTRPNWREVSKLIDWKGVQRGLEIAARQQIANRPPQPLPFAQPVAGREFFGGYH